MNLRQLELFVKIVETKSFSQAAKELYISQPTVSSHIQSLEKEMNAILLIRKSKEVSITEKGQILYGYAKKMAALEEEIKDAFNLETLKNKRTISVSSSTVPAQFVLPAILPAFCRRFPHVSFSVTETDSADVIQRVMMLDTEIGLTGTKSNHKECVFVPFCEDRLAVLVPNTPQYQELLDHKPELSQVLRQPVLVREGSSGTYIETETMLKKQGVQICDLNIVAHMNQPDMILKSVSLGLGITIMSHRAAESYLKEQKILEYELPEPIAYRNLYLVYLKNRTLSDSAENFITFVRNYFGKEK